MEDDAEEQYDDLYAVNTSTTAPDLAERRNETASLVVDISTTVTKASLSGETWLFPSAVSVLLDALAIGPRAPLCTPADVVL